MAELALADRASSGWIGTVLPDGWRIDAKIARGGVGTVFRATNPRGECAAVKILHPEFARNADVRKRFLLEGDAANRVGHSGVVRVLATSATDHGADPGPVYLLMELLEGSVLEDVRTRAGGRLPLGRACHAIRQLLEVLAAAHANGIVHRDIKPENLFMLPDGTLKVLDFGIAHVKQSAIADATATGLLLGTPEFMAPEQAQGRREIDAQTDIWGVGATMFMLLSGCPVHAAAHVSQLIVATGSRPPRSLAAVAKDIPAPIVAIVDRALAFEKNRRWPSAHAMNEALGAAIAALPAAAFHAGSPGQTNEGSMATAGKDSDSFDPEAPRPEGAPSDPPDVHNERPERTIAMLDAPPIDPRMRSPITVPPPAMAAKSPSPGRGPLVPRPVGGPPRPGKQVPAASPRFPIPPPTAVAPPAPPQIEPGAFSPGDAVNDDSPTMAGHMMSPFEGLFPIGSDPAAAPQDPLLDPLLDTKKRSAFAEPSYARTDAAAAEEDVDEQTVTTKAEELQASLRAVRSVPLDDEATRTVTRDELMREVESAIGQSAHVVVGAGADADDATVSVNPEANSAATPNVPYPAAQDMGAPGYRPQPPAAGRIPTQLGVGGFVPPSLGAAAPAPRAMPMSGPGQMYEPSQGSPYSSHGQGGPMSYPTTPRGSGHPGHPGQQPMPHAHWAGGAGAPPPQQPARFSSNVLVLGAVGTVSLTIFIIGVYLFVTTRF